MKSATHHYWLHAYLPWCSGLLHVVATVGYKWVRVQQPRYKEFVQCQFPQKATRLRRGQWDVLQKTQLTEKELKSAKRHGVLMVRQPKKVS